jgi:hypothetical protein
MTPHRTIYLWDLDLAARLKVLSRKVRWVFILNVVGSSGPGEGHEKATAAGY